MEVTYFSYLQDETERKTTEREERERTETELTGAGFKTEAERLSGQ